MYFSSLLISSFLLAPLAPAILAAPREFRRSPLDLVEKRTDAISDVKVTTNLAGAALVRDPFRHENFSFVSGTLEVPALSGQEGSIGTAWVSIDNIDMCNATFQTGITFQYTSSGPKYQPWYWWYPSEIQPFQDIGTISPGDVIDIMVAVPTNATYGVVMFNNRNTSQHSWQNVGQPDKNALCLKSAEWMVQAYGGTVLANFGTIKFKNATVIGNGTIYHPTGAIVYDIEQNGTNLTFVSVDENSVTIEYTGT